MRRASADDVGRQLAELEALDAKALRVRWKDLFDCPPPKWMQRELLLHAVAYRVQERALGGLKASTRRKLRQLTEATTAPRRAAPKLQPGSQLMREWNNELHCVDIVEAGFVWRGRTYRSLSSIAREITGTRWSGPRFFGLTGSGDSMAWRQL
ncbi:MAG: DUF2924 domain-containing protein [Sphingomonadales bacterium]